MGIIVITGGTGGIGLELARLYAARGERPLLIGRRPLATLDDPLFSPQTYLQADLSDPEQVASLPERIFALTAGRLDLLIHNAAGGYYGDPADQPAEEIVRLVQTNLKTPIALTHRLLPTLQATSGQVVFVSSVASALPAADYATYTATKAALDGFARSLRIEQGNQIHVQLLHPGATRTEMHAKLGIDQTVMNWEKFPPAAEVAAQMLAAIERKRPRQTIGLGNQLLRRAGLSGGRIVEGMMRPKLSGKSAEHMPHAVITGAADGIGRALALALVQRGIQVTGVDIDTQRIEETLQAASGPGELTFLPIDLTQPAEIARLVSALEQQPPVTHLYNNAGISAAGHFAQLPLAQQLKVVDLNLTAPLILTTSLQRAGRLAEQAHLIFISSLSKYVGYPGATVYAASKDGLSSFASSLAVNKYWPVRVTTVYPGPTRTAHARRYSPDNSREEKRMPPEALAELIIKSVARGQRILLPGGSAKMFATLGYLMPQLMEQGMKKALLDKMPAPQPTPESEVPHV